MSVAHIGKVCSTQILYDTKSATSVASKNYSSQCYTKSGGCSSVQTPQAQFPHKSIGSVQMMKSVCKVPDQDIHLELIYSNRTVCSTFGSNQYVVSDYWSPCHHSARLSQFSPMNRSRSELYLSTKSQGTT